MIWFRADGGPEIGMGHIRRCLSVAEALREMGERTCFLVADDAVVPLLEVQGQDYRVLHSSWNDLENELTTLLPVLGESGKGVFFADSYYVTDEYLRRIGELMPVCGMDDMGTFRFPVDLLINYNVFAEESLYTLNDSRTDYLLGTKYAPLRREFRNAYQPIREKAEKVLITTGGSDRYNLTGQILEHALRQLETRELEYRVVSGPYNQYLPQLMELEQQHENVRIYQNVTNMLELMQSCDIAVTAGGSTMYELCAVGVPILCFSFVDNQEKIVQGFKDRKIVSFAGNYLAQGERMIPQITEQIAILHDSVELRRTSSEKERELVDGQGAWRIARRLCEFSNGQRSKTSAS